MVFSLDKFEFKRGWGAYGHKLSEISTKPEDHAYTPNGPMAKEFVGHLTFNFSNDGLVYAADRAGNRIHVTDKQGNFKQEIKLARGDGRRRFDRRRDVLERQGAEAALHLRPDEQPRLVPRSQDGQGRGHAGQHGRERRQFFGVHMEATDSKGNLYTGEVFDGERVQRFVPADSPRGKLLEQLSRVQP